MDVPKVESAVSDSVKSEYRFEVPIVKEEPKDFDNESFCQYRDQIEINEKDIKLECLKIDKSELKLPEQTSNESKESMSKCIPEEKESQNNVKLIPKQEKLFECDTCDKSFKEKSALKVHRVIHIGEDPLKYALNPTGEKMFKCDTCKKLFKHKASLNIHKLTHTGEEPFKCDICMKKFTYKSSLNVHKLTHTGEKPFECSVCKKRFRKKSQLDMHSFTVIKVEHKTFILPRCSKTPEIE